MLLDMYSSMKQHFIFSLLIISPHFLLLLLSLHTLLLQLFYLYPLFCLHQHPSQPPSSLHLHMQKIFVHPPFLFQASHPIFHPLKLPYLTLFQFHLLVLLPALISILVIHLSIIIPWSPFPKLEFPPKKKVVAPWFIKLLNRPLPSNKLPKTSIGFLPWKMNTLLYGRTILDNLFQLLLMQISLVVNECINLNTNMVPLIDIKLVW